MELREKEREEKTDIEKSCIIQPNRKSCYKTVYIDSYANCQLTLINLS